MEKSTVSELFTASKDEELQWVRLHRVDLYIYSGIVSAILVGTLSVLPKFWGQPAGPALLLLVGPALGIGLSIIGWRTCNGAYRRFLEAVTWQAKLEPLVGVADDRSEESKKWVFPDDSNFVPDRWPRGCRSPRTAKDFVNTRMGKGSNRLVHLTFGCLIGAHLILAFLVFGAARSASQPAIDRVANVQDVGTVPNPLPEATAGSFLLVNAGIALVSLVAGWFLKVLADRMSHRTLFDHRLRLEKEYGLYSDLWDNLFELRRSVGQLVKPPGTTADVRHDEHVTDAFNAYQAVVRKGEPFMTDEVYAPSRQIVTLARNIIGNVGKQQRIGERREKGLGAEADEELADKQIALDEQNDAAFKQIEQLFQEVKRAIRKRVSP